MEKPTLDFASVELLVLPRARFTLSALEQVKLNDLSAAQLFLWEASLFDDAKAVWDLYLKKLKQHEIKPTKQNENLALSIANLLAQLQIHITRIHDHIIEMGLDS